MPKLTSNEQARFNEIRLYLLLNNTIRMFHTRKPLDTIIQNICTYAKLDYEHLYKISINIMGEIFAPRILELVKLSKKKGNTISETAKILNIPRTTVYSKLEANTEAIFPRLIKEDQDLLSKFFEIYDQIFFKGVI